MNKLPISCILQSGFFFRQGGFRLFVVLLLQNTMHEILQSFSCFSPSRKCHLIPASVPYFPDFRLRFIPDTLSSLSPFFILLPTKFCCPRKTRAYDIHWSQYFDRVHILGVFQFSYCNEVCFMNDPVFLRKFRFDWSPKERKGLTPLIPDPWSQPFHPWPHPIDTWSHPTNTWFRPTWPTPLIPGPTLFDPRSQPYVPWSHPFHSWSHTIDPWSHPSDPWSHPSDPWCHPSDPWFHPSVPWSHPSDSWPHPSIPWSHPFWSLIPALCSLIPPLWSLIPPFWSLVIPPLQISDSIPLFPDPSPSDPLFIISPWSQTLMNRYK